MLMIVNCVKRSTRLSRPALLIKVQVKVKWDNTEVISQLLALRLELAKLLGFDNYAEYSLATKMAENTDQVVQFLTDLAREKFTCG